MSSANRVFFANICIFAGPVGFWPCSHVPLPLLHARSSWWWLSAFRPHPPFVLVAATGKQGSSSSCCRCFVAFPEPVSSSLAVAGTIWETGEYERSWQLLEAVPVIPGGSRALWGQSRVYEPQETPVFCLSRGSSNTFKKKQQNLPPCCLLQSCPRERSPRDGHAVLGIGKQNSQCLFPLSQPFVLIFAI